MMFTLFIIINIIIILFFCHLILIYKLIRLSF